MSSRGSVLHRLLRWWVSPEGLAAGVAGFLAGYWLMWNVELQFIWMVAMVFPALCRQWREAKAAGVLRDPALRIMLALIVLTLTVGLIRHFPKAEWNYRWEFLVGALAMPPMFAALWIVCRQGRAGMLLQTCAWSGALAAAVSLVWWHEVQAVETAGARLRNPLVYGGLHPVPTGIFGGFALLALAWVYLRAERRAVKSLVLLMIFVTTLAMLFTISRGAMLACLCGLTVLPFLVGVRRSWPVLTTVAGTAVFFQLFAGALTPVPALTPVIDGKRVILLETVSANPARELMAREDSGRLRFYRIGTDMVNTWPKRLTGAGLWETDDQLERETRGTVNQFHSLPVATYIHSGVLGCTLLLAAILGGLRCALRLARQGQGEWLTLLAFGGGGLLFDGQSACSLVTHPRFEALLLWVPLVAVSALANRRHGSAGE